MKQQKINHDAPRNDEIYGQDGQLLGCVIKPLPCGCEVIGDGILPRPITIEFCKKHKAVDDLLEACKAFKAWDEKYPSSRIYSHSAMTSIIKKLNEVAAKTKQAIAKAE